MSAPAVGDRWPGVIAATLLAIAISLWPFLSYLGNNIELGLSPGDILPLGAKISALVLLVGGLIRLVVRRAAWGRLVCTIAVGAALFFCYDILRAAAEVFTLERLHYTVPIWVAVFLAGTALTWLMLGSRNGFLILSAAVIGTLLLPVGQIALHYAGALAAGELASLERPAEMSTAPSDAATRIRPDVFFFVFDRYSRADQLRRWLDFDNSDFIAALEARGYYVASKSRANYVHTILSLASTLSMDYHYTDGDFALGGLQRIMKGSNETVRRFRRLGYTYVYARPSFWYGSHCTGIEDVCIEPTTNVREHHRALLELTPLGHMALFLDPKVFSLWLNSTGDVTLATVRERLAEEPRRPLFVFAHMMFPHAPYRFNPDCSYRDSEPATDREGYLDNTSCTNRQILETVDWIAQRNPGAIVILQGDHGHLTGRSYTKDDDGLPIDLDWESFDGRAGILNAWRLPEACRRHLTPSITAVNTFRLVFACLEGREPEFLDDRVFVSSYVTFKLREFSGGVAP